MLRPTQEGQMGLTIGEIQERLTTLAFLPSSTPMLPKVTMCTLFCFVKAMDYKSLEWMIYLKVMDELVCILQ